jgi:SPP1 gp7 family putative phage head morphogenesis protein
MPDRTRNPIITGSNNDRTGSGVIVRRALADITRRFDGLQADVLAVFDGIRTYGLNDESGAVAYALTPEEMAAVSQAMADALDRWISAGKEPAHLMWYAPYDVEASQLGAAQAVANLSALAPAYASVRSLQAIIYSTPYKTRVGMAQVKSYEHWTGLSGGMRSELSQIIGRAVVDGKNPKAVRKEIMDRLDVSKARANLYAQTDITDTLRQSRWAESDYAEESLGIKTGMLWTSALKPTTRPSHAARHGKVYTTNEVRDFYGKDGNRMHCFCACTEALLDEDGKPILTDRLKQVMTAERKGWKPAD